MTWWTLIVGVAILLTWGFFCFRRGYTEGYIEGYIEHALEIEGINGDDEDIVIEDGIEEFSFATLTDEDLERVYNEMYAIHNDD